MLRVLQNGLHSTLNVCLLQRRIATRNRKDRGTGFATNVITLGVHQKIALNVTRLLNRKGNTLGKRLLPGRLNRRRIDNAIRSTHRLGRLIDNRTLISKTWGQSATARTNLGRRIRIPLLNGDRRLVTLNNRRLLIKNGRTLTHRRANLRGVVDQIRTTRNLRRSTSIFINSSIIRVNNGRINMK